MVLEGVDNLELKILNRWGQVVYTTKALQFAWDGRSGAGEPVSDGTYYWVLAYDGAKGPGEQHGVVTVMR